MDFDFSDDQEQLRDAVRKWVDKGYDFERRRKAAKAGGFDRAAWSELAELGLCGLYISEADGGLGMGPVEGMVVMEELGRGIVLEPFAHTLLITLASGLLIWLPVRRQKLDLRNRDGFLVVVAFWVTLSLLSAIPFMLSDKPHMPLVDAVFEAVSGLTTTGATVLTGIDDLPRAIVYYRAQLNFFGGMGIVVLAVALLPVQRRRLVSPLRPRL